MNLSLSLINWLKERDRWVSLFQNWLEQGFLQNRNLRLFVISEAVCLIGAQFFQIALPWLVMQLTGSATAIGGAIVLSGLSRIAFILVGGALVDRFSPHKLILVGNGIRAVVLALFTLSIAAGWINLLMLYGFNFALGFTDAILFPARGAIMPLLVGQDHLRTANSLMSGQDKFWGLTGPTLVGEAITWIDRLNKASWHSTLTAKNLLGVTAAFAITAVTIAGSVLFLRRVRLTLPQVESSSKKEEEEEEHTGSLKEVAALIWQQKELRISFLMVYVINLVSGFPLYIGLPMLAVSRFTDGAAALGLLQSASGLGALLGALLAAILPRPEQQRIRRVFFTAIFILVAGLALLVTSATVVIGGLAVMMMTGAVSYISITGISEIQRITPSHFLGRVMALLNLK